MEAVGHADGDLDPVVERLEPGVGAARFDGARDVGAASPDFFDKLAISAAHASNRSVNPPPGLAHGTGTVPTPCTGQQKREPTSKPIAMRSSCLPSPASLKSTDSTFQGDCNCRAAVNR